MKIVVSQNYSFLFLFINAEIYKIFTNMQKIRDVINIQLSGGVSPETCSEGGNFLPGYL
jgi:hypothetical protein